MTKLFYRINDGEESEIAMIPKNGESFALIEIKPKEFPDNDNTHIAVTFADGKGNKFEIGYRREPSPILTIDR